MPSSCISRVSGRPPVGLFLGMEVVAEADIISLGKVTLTARFVRSREIRNGFRLISLHC